MGSMHDTVSHSSIALFGSAPLRCSYSNRPVKEGAASYITAALNRRRYPPVQEQACSGRLNTYRQSIRSASGLLTPPNAPKSK